MRLLLIIYFSFLVLSCGSGDVKPTAASSRFELIPEPDKDLREAYEKRQLDIQVKEKELIDLLSSFLVPLQAADSSYVAYWCSIDQLDQTALHLEQLSLTHVGELLATFSPNCANNVEYMEWSNELLFEVALRQPEDFYELLVKNGSLHRDLILHQLENPGRDDINLQGIKVGFEELAVNPTEHGMYWKKRLVLAFDRALLNASVAQ